MARQTKVKEVTQEVKYIRCEIAAADVDTTSGIVTLTVENIEYQSDIATWFVDGFKPTYYRVELDMSKDAHRSLLFDRLLKYCFNVAKYDKILDKIQKGLIGYTWKFSENILQKVA